MPQLLTLSRAARLVGVTRGALQKKIRDGELETFEGMLKADELLRVYPQTELEDNTEFDRVTSIKKHAFAKRVRERVLPDAEILATRLNELAHELARARGELTHYQSILGALGERVRALIGNSDGAAAGALEDMAAWLEQQLRQQVDVTQLSPLLARDTLLTVMSANVELYPSRHDFFVEGIDNLLHAALNSGLAVNYGCSDGSCGKCRARVMTGIVKETREPLFALSEDERRRGHILMCCNTAVTDLELQADEAGGASDVPRQKIVARLKSVERHSDSMIVLNVRTPKSQRLRFLSGQSVTLGVGDEPFKADYPVASCPCDDRNLQFHVRRLPDDEFSRYVFDKLESHENIYVDGPKGNFILQDESPNPIVFIAYETGFAPIKSLIEQAMALEMAETMHLYRYTPGDADPYMHNLCRAWADALDNFAYTALPAGDDITVSLQRVFDDHVDLPEYDVYLAAPADIVAAMREVLIHHPQAPAQLFTQDIV